jgi:hypothetical protein
MRPPVSAVVVLTLVGLLGAVAGLQALRREIPALPVPAAASGGAAPVITSTDIVKGMVLNYDALAADVYWMRVVQQFGSTRLSTATNKNYDFLYPMLDLTTALDPDFEVAYRFGAVFLAEEYPAGAGRSDLALRLLQKGLEAHPTQWQYAQDIGFVYYWWRNDYVTAAEWFRRAAAMPHAPNWLEPLAAVTLTQGGNRAGARRLWQQVNTTADSDWLKTQAQFRLSQLDALDQIDALERLVARYRERTGQLPERWDDLLRARLIPGVPVDPHGFPYELNPYWGTVGLGRGSTLAPLPVPAQAPQ